MYIPTRIGRRLEIYTAIVRGCVVFPKVSIGAKLLQSSTEQQQRRLVRVYAGGGRVRQSSVCVCGGGALIQCCLN